MRTFLLAAVIAWGIADVLGTRAEDAPSGTIRGTVRDPVLDVTMAGVEVSIAETQRTTVTSAEGEFVFEGVAPGAYSLLFDIAGYDTQVVPVLVVAGTPVEVRAELKSQSMGVEETTVTAPALPDHSETGLLETRAEAAPMQDAVSSETIARSGAGDASGAVKLVVGTSVSAGKYVTVRGLSDRYTGTTVDGVRVPSPDPRRRAVQVDLFPTGTIDSVTVTKTFTPDLQGDFTGGGVDIKTKAIPDGRVLSVSLSSESNSQATHDPNFLSYQGGSVEPLGFGAEDRALPQGAAQPQPALPGFSATPTGEQQEASRAYDRLSRSFAPVMGVSRKEPGVNRGLSLVAGNWFKFGQAGVFGVMGALTYAHKYDAYHGAANNSAVVSDASQPITLTKARVDSRGTDELLMGALVNVVFQPKENHELSLKVLGTQSAEDEARYQVERTGYPSVEQNQSLQYTERTLLSTQLHGSHTLDHAMGVGGPSFGTVVVDWMTAVNATRQDEPDVRFFRNAFDLETLSGNMPSNSTDAQNTRRIFRDIEEDNVQGGVNVTLPFSRFADIEGRLKSGVLVDRTDRGYQQRSFTYVFPNQFGSVFDPVVGRNRSLSQFVASSPAELWTDVFLSPDRIGLAGSAPSPNQLLWVVVPLGNDVDYTGDQVIDAAYAMAEVPLHPKLEVVGGARWERTDLSIRPVNDAFGRVEIIDVLSSGDRAIVDVPQEEANAEIRQNSVLPSLGVAYSVGAGAKLRLSWSRTLARPTFRELAPVATEEFLFGDEFLGNPDLVLSKITNWDARWEWFPRPGEVMAVSGFYKEIEDPIELISFSAGGRSFIQPVNYERGRVLGAELELRSSLDALHDRLRGLHFGTNLSWIDSEVSVPLSEQLSLAAFGLDEPTRRLQGQPEFLFNYSLAYDIDRTGTSVGILYNVVGESLVSGAARGISDGNPNVFERRFGTFDLSLNQTVKKRVSLSLKVKNLLRPARTTVFRTPTGEETVKTERETPMLVGVSGSLRW